MSIQSRYTRLRSVFFVYIFLFLFFSLRLFHVQVLRYSYFSNLAKKQHDLVVKIEPVRGTIYDRNLRALAFSINLDSIYANARRIKDPVREAALLSDILGIKRVSLIKKFTKDKAFVWIARKVSPETADKVKELKLPYIGFLKEPKRFYPNEKMACHLIGFAGLDNTGLEGVEAVCDEYLRGEYGRRFAKQDARQRELPSYESRYIPPAHGYNVVLTIDMVLQGAAETQLDVIMRKFHPKAATIILMEPATGRILALANRPNFAPNDFQDFNALARKNRAVTDIFEPGSIFKIITASAVLQEEKAVFGDKFFCENGKFTPFASYTLHDYRPYGWLTFRRVLENSSNIGIGKIAGLIGRQVLYDYIKAYGFGQKTNIDLAGEVSGIIRPPSEWSRTSIWNIPMGQEVAVTAIQMVTAISAIANNGVLMKPYLIERIERPDGGVIKSFAPAAVRRVLSEKAARQMQEILAGVVENGTGRPARIKGVRAAGKTGTAQKIGSSGRYSRDKYVGSFIGFAPANEAAVACIVTVDEPRPVHFGSVVAAPAFSEAVGQSIEYLKAKAILKR